jgi:hypothetical protein
MDPIIAVLASCEVRDLISFIHAEGQSAVEIHPRLCRVYDDNVISECCVREWCRKFRAGRIDVHENCGQKRHSIVTDEFVRKVVREFC